MGVILLVRHGQASFGLGDYDRLSARGAEQTMFLGRRIAAMSGSPTQLWSGQLSRQRATLDRVQNALPSGDDAPVRTEDGRLDEFDHQSILRAHKPAWRSRPLMLADLARSRDAKARFQEVFHESTVRWATGDDDASYGESFPAFVARCRAVSQALQQSAADGTVLAASSGGVISAICADLLGLGGAGWLQMNRVMVNASITKLITGRESGKLTMVSFNDHAHLEHDRSLITYR